MSGLTLPESRLAYRVNEVAEMLCCSGATLYRMFADGKLRAVKRGRHTLILKDDLQTYLDNLDTFTAGDFIAVGDGGSVGTRKKAAA